MVSQARFAAYGLGTFGCAFLISMQAFAVDRCKAFSDSERRAYTQATGAPSHLKAVLQLIRSPLTETFGIRTPKFLRGVVLNAVWIQEPDFATTSDVSAQLDGPWGIGEIFTQATRQNRLAINFRPSSEGELLTPAQIETLKSLYPTLSQGHLVPSGYRLVLFREHFGSDANFEASARSFVNTVFNDPQGVLGMNPKNALPKALLKFDGVEESAKFLASLGRWSAVDGGLTVVETPASFNSEQVYGRAMNVTIDTKSKRMSVGLGTDLFRQTTLEQIRRIVRAADVSLMLRSETTLPPTSVFGLSSIHVTDLHINWTSLYFLRLLTEYRHDQNFSQPLAGLSDQMKNEIHAWIGGGGLLQNEMNAGKIRYEDIVAGD